MIYLFSSIVSEAISMLIYYPYEIFKVRYIAKNDKYRYKGITDCFTKIVKTNGVPGLYKGSPMFLVNYVGSNNI